MDDTDDKGIEIECFDAFPPHLIKASLQKNEDTGVVLKTAIEFIGACSAIFLKKILSENPSILQLQQSRDYDFMSGILDDIVPDDERVDERTLSGGLKRRHKHKPPAKRQSKSKKRRYTKKLKEASQLSKETLPILSSSKHKEIEVDDDDYD